MQVTVTVADDHMEVDFAGSSPAVPGPVNMPFGATIAMAKVLLKSLTTPNEPGNAGHTRALVVKAEPGPCSTRYTHRPPSPCGPVSWLWSC